MQQCNQQQDRGTQEHVLRAAEGDARDNQQQYISSPQYPKDEQQPLQQGKPAQPRPQPRQEKDHWTRLAPVQQQEKQHSVERLQQQNPCKQRDKLVSSPESEKQDVWLDDTDTVDNAEQWDAFCCFVEQQEDQPYPGSAATPRVATCPHSAATPATFVNDYAAAAPPSSAAAVRTFKVDPNDTGTAAFASAAVFAEYGANIAEDTSVGKLSASPARAYTRSLMDRSCSGKREEVLIPGAAAVASMPAPRRYSAVSAQRYQQNYVIQKNVRHHLRQKQRQEQQPYQQQQQWHCRDQQQRPQVHQHRQRMLFASFKKYVVERNCRNKAGERQQQELQEDVLAALRLPPMRRRLLSASKGEKSERDLTSLQHQQQTPEEQHQHLQQHRRQVWPEQSAQRNLHGAPEKQMQGYYQTQQPEEGEFQQQLKKQQQNGKIHAVRPRREEQQQTPEEVTKTQQWCDGPDGGVQRHRVGGDTTQHREQQAPYVEGNMHHQQREGKEEDKEEHECFEDDGEQQQQERQRRVQYQPEKHQQHKKNAEAKKQATGVRYCPQIKDVGGREHESTLRAGLEQRQPQQRQQQRAVQEVLHLALVQQRQQDETKTPQQQERQHGIQQHLQRAWQKQLHQEEWNQQQQQKRQQQQQRYEKQDREHAHEEQRQKNSQERELQERKKETSLPTNWQPTMQEKPQQIQQEQEQGRQHRKRQQKAPFIIRPQAEEKHKQQEEEQHMGQQQVRQKNQGSRIFLQHRKGRRIDMLLQEEVYNNRIHATLDALAAAQRAWLRQERERLNTRRFTVLQLLGRGAAGSVYLVEDCSSTGRGRRGKRRRCSNTRSGKRYALKVIPKQSFQTPAARRRVLLEQQVFMDLQQLRQAMQRRKQLQGREERQSAKQQRSAPKKQQRLQENAKQHRRSKKPLPPLPTRNTCCVRLEGSFQDAENLYQLLEYLPGGDLRAKINAAVAVAPSKTAPAQEAAGRRTCSFKEETGSTHSSMATTSYQAAVVQGISSLHGAIGDTACVTVARSAAGSFARATKITATATTVTATEGAAAAGASTGDKKAAQRKVEKAAPGKTLPAFAAASANSEAVVVAAGAAEGGHLRAGTDSEGEAPCAAAAAGSSARVVTEVHKHASAAIAGKTRPLAASVGGDRAMTAADTGELHAAAGFEGLGCFRIACMRESERRRIFAQIVWGVRTLHALGYIHRDIKPENVAFDGAGNAKLLDFGLCCRPVHAREHGQQGKQPKQQQLLLLRQGRQQRQQGERHKSFAPTGQTGQPQWLVQTQHTHQRRQRLHEERRTRQQQQMQANLQREQQRWQLQLGRQQQHREAQVENRESKASACAWQTQAIRGSNSEAAEEEQAQQRVGRPAAGENTGDGEERRTVRRRSTHADGLVRARSADGGRVTLLSRWEKDAASSPPCAAHPAALSFAPAAAAVPADYAVTACAAASSACDVSDTFAVPAASSVAVRGPPSTATAAGGVRKSAAAAAFAASDSGSLSACGDAVTASIFRRRPASPAIASLSSSFSKDHARARSRRNATSVLFSCLSSALHPLSVAGTLQYMAPEVLLQQQYSFAADWWSVGVMLFECTYGCLPFCFPACDSELLLRTCSSKLRNSSGVHAGSSTPLEPPYVKASSSTYLSLSNVHAFSTRVLLQPYLNGRGKNSEHSSLLSCTRNDLLAPHLEACSSTLTQLPDMHAEREGCGLRLPFQGDAGGNHLVPLSKMDARANTAQARGPSHAHARPWFVPSSNVLLLSLFLRERYERGGFCPAFLFFADTGENAAGKKQHRHAQQQSTTVKNKPAVQGGIEVDADEKDKQQRGKGEDDESDGEGEGEDRVGRAGGESAVVMAKGDGKVRVGKGIGGGKPVQTARKRREQLHRVQLELRQQQQQQVREKKQNQQEQQMLLRERDKQRSPQKQQQQTEVKQHQEGRLDQQQLWSEMQHLHLNTQKLATPVDEEEYDFRVSNACIQVMQNLLCGSRKRWNFRQLCACAWLRDYFGSHGDAATTCNERQQQHSEEMQHQRPMCGRSKLQLQRQRRRKQQQQQRRQQQHTQCMRDCCWKPQQMQNLKGNWRLNLRQQHLHLQQQQQHVHTQQQQQQQHDVRAQQQQQAEQQREVHTQPQQWQQRHRFQMQQSQQQLRESTPTLVLQQQPVVQQRRVRQCQSRTRCRSRQQQELHQQRSRGGLLDDVARADRRDSSSPRLPAEAAATILAAAEATAEAAGDAAPAEQVEKASGEALAAESPTAAASKAALEAATRWKRKPTESFLLLPTARFGRSPRIRQMCRSTCRRKVDYPVHDTGSSKSKEEEQDAWSSCSHQTSLREGGNACSSRVCDNSNSKASWEYEADGRRLRGSKCRNSIRGRSLNRQSSPRNSSREICYSGYTRWTRESSECGGSTSGSDGNAPSSSACSRIYSRETRTRDSNRETWYSGSSWCSCSSSSWHSSTRGGRDSGSRRRRSATRVLTASSYRSSSTCSSSSSGRQSGTRNSSYTSRRSGSSEGRSVCCDWCGSSGSRSGRSDRGSSGSRSGNTHTNSSSTSQQSQRHHRLFEDARGALKDVDFLGYTFNREELQLLLRLTRIHRRLRHLLQQHPAVALRQELRLS